MNEPILKKIGLLYTFVIAGAQPLAEQIVDGATVEWFPIAIVSIFMIVTILPELSLVFPTYRKQITDGLQNGDGSTNANDLKLFISWYGPFTALRAIIFMALFSMAVEYDPPNEIIYALVAVGTGTALPHLKEIFTKPKG